MVPAGIATQILSAETTPSEQPAAVNASAEESQTDLTSEKPGIDFDSRLGVLTKMERKIKEAEARMKEQEREWGEKGKKLSELENFAKLFEENPLEALKQKKGWGVQEFNEHALQFSSDEDLDPVAKLTKNFTTQLDELRAKLTEEFEGKIKQKEEEISAKDRDRQVSEFKGTIKNFLSENKEAYEFIHAEEGAMEEVFNLIQADVQKQLEAEVPHEKLRIMDVKEAADKVEAFLDKQYSKYLSLNKVKSKFQPNNEDLGRFIASKSKEEPTTLTSSFSPKSKPVDQLSEKERKESAVAFLRSQKT